MKTKQLFVILLVMILPTGAFCQLDKGSWMGSATAGFIFSGGKNTYDNGSSKSSALEFLLDNRLGIFVANRLVVGPGFNISTEYSTYKSNDPSQEDVKNHSTYYNVSFDPFVRYYFLHQGNLALFGQISGDIGYGQQFYYYKNGSMEEQKSTNDNLSYGGGVAFGFVYFVNPHIGIETSLQYYIRGSQFSGGGYKDKVIDNEIALNAGFSFYFGKCSKKEKEKEKE